MKTCGTFPADAFNLANGIAATAANGDIPDTVFVAQTLKGAAADTQERDDFPCRKQPVGTAFILLPICLRLSLDIGSDIFYPAYQFLISTAFYDDDFHFFAQN